MLFGPARDDEPIRAVPGTGLEVPLWILGSSTFGARLAALLGLPYAFASHFAPTDLLAALELYRRDFRPSAQLAEPYAMAGLNVYAADTDEEARRLFTTPQQSWANRFRGALRPLPAADRRHRDVLVAGREGAGVGDALVLGGRVARDRARRAWSSSASCTGVDELMVVTAIYDHAARVRSYEILAEAV